MDWDEAGDRSLMEWQEQEEPDRVRKRKASIRSRRQCGVITNIPPERKNSIRRVEAKYLLVGVLKTRVNIDHPRMAVLDMRIKKAALMIEEKSSGLGSGSSNTESTSDSKFSQSTQSLNF